jgi:hypothetical protein
MSSMGIATALGFSDIIHGHSDSESTGNTSSRINGKYNHAKDGLGDIARVVSNDETIGDINVGERGWSPR